MATTHPNLAENPIKLRKFRKFSQKTNGISFWAFLISIFIYISIFYIFNLSPLSLFNSTKFWFFISNTLILIIAADFGAFFSSGESNFYQDYLKTAEARTACSSPSFEYYMQRPNLIEKKKIQEKVIHEIEPHEEIKSVVVPRETEAARTKHEIVVKEMEIVTKTDSEKHEGNNFQVVNTLQVKAHNPVHHEVQKSEAKCTRSNSEVGILFADNEEKKSGLQRSLSERYNLKNVEENNDEFSEMSVEELNRRVEEFIQRFNRQIRLQAASRKHQI